MRRSHCAADDPETTGHGVTTVAVSSTPSRRRAARGSGRGARHRGTRQSSENRAGKPLAARSRWLRQGRGHRAGGRGALGNDAPVPSGDEPAPEDPPQVENHRKERVPEDARVRLFTLQLDSVVAVQAFLDQAEWRTQPRSFKRHVERKPAMTTMTEVIDVATDVMVPPGVSDNDAQRRWDHLSCRAARSKNCSVRSLRRASSLGSRPQSPMAASADADTYSSHSGSESSRNGSIMSRCNAR